MELLYPIPVVCRLLPGFHRYSLLLIASTHEAAAVLSEVVGSQNIFG